MRKRARSESPRTDQESNQSRLSLFISSSKASLLNFGESGLVIFLCTLRQSVHLGADHMKVISSRQMNEIGERSAAHAAKHTASLYFQTTLTHISLTAFQRTNLLSGSRGTHLIFAWKGGFSLFS